MKLGMKLTIITLNYYLFLKDAIYFGIFEKVLPTKDNKFPSLSFAKVEDK